MKKLVFIISLPLYSISSYSMQWDDMPFDVKFLITGSLTLSELEKHVLVSKSQKELIDYTRMYLLTKPNKYVPVYFSSKKLRCNLLRDMHNISHKHNKAPYLSVKVKYLSHKKDLEELSQYCTYVKYICFLHTTINDDHIPTLSKMIWLKRLHIEDSLIGPEGCLAIATMSNLESLCLHNSLTPNWGARIIIQRMTNLIKLDLSYNCIDDNEIKDITKMSKLKTLNLSNNMISDTGVLFTNTMTWLKKLYL